MASVAKEPRRVSQHKRCVNDLIHEREGFEEHRRNEPVAFVCECPSSVSTPSSGVRACN